MISRTWDHVHDMSARISCPGDSGGGICAQLCIYPFKSVQIAIYDMGGCHMCVAINPERDRLSLQLCINFMMFLVYLWDNQYDIITRWWMKQLSQAKSSMRHAARTANKVNNNAQHPSHREYHLKHNAFKQQKRNTEGMVREHWWNKHMDSKLHYIRPFHRWQTYQNTSHDDIIKQWTISTSHGQQAQGHSTLQNVLSITRSLLATRPQWKISSPGLQIQSGNQSANQTHDHKNKSLQGQWTLKCGFFYFYFYF